MNNLDRLMQDVTADMLDEHGLHDEADVFRNGCTCGEVRRREDGSLSDVLLRDGRFHYFDGTRCSR